MTLKVFSKAIELISVDDLHQLISEAWPEGYDVEYKETLPHKKGGDSAWLTGGDEIEPYARRAVLAEVIAFANAGGGTLFLGIRETKSKPPRAETLRPLPRIGELARRLEDQVRACVEPPITRVRIRAIETGAAGEGIIIIKTGASRSGPHRVLPEREAYTRRGSSTVEITMREIQEMSVNALRERDDVNRAFHDRSAHFREWAALRNNSAAWRVTAVPLDPVPDPGRLVGKSQFLPPYRSFQAKIAGSDVQLEFPITSASERPIIRGVARRLDADYGSINGEIYQNGMIDLWVANFPRDTSAPETMPESRVILYHGEVMASVANTLSMIDNFRTEAGAPDAEFALEVGFYCGHSVRNLAPLYYGFFGHHNADRKTITDFPARLPRLPVGPSTEFNELMRLIDTDIYDMLGSNKQAPTINVFW